MKTEHLPRGQLREQTGRQHCTLCLAHTRCAIGCGCPFYSLQGMQTGNFLTVLGAIGGSQPHLPGNDTSPHTTVLLLAGSPRRHRASRGSVGSRSLGVRTEGPDTCAHPLGTWLCCLEPARTVIKSPLKCSTAPSRHSCLPLLCLPPKAIQSKPNPKVQQLFKYLKADGCQVLHTA